MTADVFAHAATAFARQSSTYALAFAIMIGVETALPRERVSGASRLRGAAFWLFYLALAAAFLTAVEAVLDWMGVRPLFKLSAMAGADQITSLAYAGAATLAALLVADFTYYWCHRIQHRWLWRFHAVHHSLREMNAINCYHHWTEELVRLPLVTIPVALLAPEGARLPVILFATLGHAFYTHSPNRIHFGPLRVVVADNVWHRLHHSLEPQHHDKNFAALFSIWDVLFGTAVYPRPGEWPETGVADFPEPRSFSEYLTAPFAWKRSPSAPRPRSRWAANR